MSHSHFMKILVVLTALLVCASVMQAQVSPLTATPATVSLTYQKPATAGSGVPVLVKATASTPFFVNASSVPIWLSLDKMSDTADSTGVTVTFTPNAVGGTLGAGSFYASVKLNVVGISALTTLSVPVTLVVSDPTPTLTVSGGSGLTFNWTQGSTFPTKTLTVVSTNEPLAFTVTAAVISPTSPANWIQVSRSSGVAYSWGTPVVVSFNPLLAYSANLGGTLTGTVTVTPAGGSAIDTSVSITVTAPVAAITSLWPAAIPPQTSGTTYTVIVTGSGFVSGTTAVTVAGNALTPTVVNSSTMMLAIPVADLGTPGPVAIAAHNGSDTPSSATLTVTTSPIIYAVTNGASYQQESPGAAPNLAPYDLISIFGDNFGPGASEVVAGTPDSTFFNFPASLTTAASHPVVVNFYKADGTTLISAAPLLFASEQQINAVVPAAVAGNAHVKITVSYNSVESSQLQATVVTADPGIFTVNANGTGQGAILNSDYTANSSTVQAKAGNIVMIYLTGLGSPTSTGANTTQTSQTFPKSCISTAAYMGTVNGQSVPPSPLWTSIDGAVIHAAWLATKVFPPCFATAPTVTIGGKTATVSYAGFVADSVGGLYQINAAVPTSVTAGTAVPVVVSVGTATSQPGVTMAVVASGGH